MPHTERNTRTLSDFEFAATATGVVIAGTILTLAACAWATGQTHEFLANTALAWKWLIDRAG